MDSSLYKDLTVSRGFTYHCYFSPPAEGKPYLFFLHGFPSTSQDWRFQVPYFKGEGYGIVVPDMLGYGGSSKPTDPAVYTGTRVAKDLIEILDAEKVEKVIAIGHDWGALYNARLADYYQDRFIAFAFLSVGYIAPSPPAPYEAMMAMTKKIFGYEIFGYWDFLSSPEAESKIMANFDSFLTLMYAADTKLWIPHVASLGGMKAWVEAGNTTTPGSYLSEDDYKQQAETLKVNGLAAPLTYYKTAKGNLHALDNAELLAKGVAPITKPTFFGASLRDYVSLAAVMKAETTKNCPNLTIKEYDAGHWVMFECKDEVTKDLAEWLKGLDVAV